LLLANVGEVEALAATALSLVEGADSLGLILVRELAGAVVRSTLGLRAGAVLAADGLVGAP